MDFFFNFSWNHHISNIHICLTHQSILLWLHLHGILFNLMDGLETPHQITPHHTTAYTEQCCGSPIIIRIDGIYTICLFAPLSSLSFQISDISKWLPLFNLFTHFAYIPFKGVRAWCVARVITSSVAVSSVCDICLQTHIKNRLSLCTIIPTTMYALFVELIVINVDVVLVIAVVVAIFAMLAQWFAGVYFWLIIRYFKAIRIFSIEF